LSSVIGATSGAAASTIGRVDMSTHAGYLVGHRVRAEQRHPARSRVRPIDEPRDVSEHILRNVVR
jgi:hypothetical protein